MPRKIRELIRDLEQAGFYLVKGQTREITASFGIRK
jgi:hypothetical protein